MTEDLQGPPSPPAEVMERARRRGFRTLMRVLGGGARVRFRHAHELSFSTADVVRVRELAASEDGADPRWEVTTSFLGLSGMVSPLPSYLAEEALASDSVAERRVGELLDLIHHRVLSLFSDADRKHDLAGSYTLDAADDWSRRVALWLGFDGEESRGGEPPWRFLRLAPLLAEPFVTGRALALALADALTDDAAVGEQGTLGVRIEPLAGRTVTLAAGERSRLGHPTAVLGRTAILGARIFDAAGKFRVILGPLTAAQYRAPRLVAQVAQAHRLIRALIEPSIAYELSLWLMPDAALPVSLSATGPGVLGRSAWLGRQRDATLVPQPFDGVEEGG